MPRRPRAGARESRDEELIARAEDEELIAGLKAEMLAENPEFTAEQVSRLPSALPPPRRGLSNGLKDRNAGLGRWAGTHAHVSSSVPAAGWHSTA